MKAVVHTQYGSTDVLRVTDVPMPAPKENEVRVKIYATTVNRTDCGFRTGKPFIVRFFSGLTKPKRTILGSEFAGVVDAVGNAVKNFTIGDKVFGLTGDDFGAHAQYVCIPESGAITHMPANLTFDEAASIPDGAMLALSLVKATKVGAGLHVLVYGATGSIGSATVQFAKHFGARVTAVGNTKNIDLVRSLGADDVIDYLKEDYATRNTMYDVVIDAVGKTSFGHCKKSLKAKGIYVGTEFGAWLQNPIYALTTPLFGGKKVLFPLPTVKKSDVELFKELAESGELRPVIDRVYPLHDIVEAYKYVETGEKTGNVVITIDPVG